MSVIPGAVRVRQLSACHENDNLKQILRLSLPPYDGEAPASSRDVPRPVPPRAPLPGRGEPQDALVHGGPPAPPSPGTDDRGRACRSTRSSWRHGRPTLSAASGSTTRMTWSTSSTWSRRSPGTGFHRRRHLLVGRPGVQDQRPRRHGLLLRSPCRPGRQTRLPLFAADPPEQGRRNARHPVQLDRPNDSQTDPCRPDRPHQAPARRGRQLQMRPAPRGHDPRRPDRLLGASPRGHRGNRQQPSPDPNPRPATRPRRSSLPSWRRGTGPVSTYSSNGKPTAIPSGPSGMPAAS